MDIVTYGICVVLQLMPYTKHLHSPNFWIFADNFIVRIQRCSWTKLGNIASTLIVRCMNASIYEWIRVWFVCNCLVLVICLLLNKYMHVSFYLRLMSKCVFCSKRVFSPSLVHVFTAGFILWNKLSYLFIVSIVSTYLCKCWI